MTQKSFEEEFALSSRGVIDVPFWTRFVRGIGVRFRRLEQIVIDWEAVQAQGLAVLLQRLNEVLVPAAQRIRDLTELGWLVAPSTTSVLLEAGKVATFEVTAGVRRDLFVPSPFVAVTREANAADFAIGRVVRYTRETGVLEVLIEDLHGAPGPFADWQVAAVAASVQSQISSLEEVRTALATAVNAAAAAATNRGLTAEDAMNTLSDRLATSRDRLATAVHVGEARAAAQEAATFDPDLYVLRSVVDGELANLRQEVASAIAAIPVAPAIAPIIVAAPPHNTTANAVQTFVAKLEGYAADTLGYYSDYGFPQASRALNVYLPSSPSVIFKTTGAIAGAGNSIPSVNLQTLGLTVSTDYLAEIVLTDVRGNETRSAKSRFTTPAQWKPKVGDPFQGGTVVVVDFVDGGSTVHLISAPKSGGETGAAWDTQSIIRGAGSRTNGPANSANPDSSQGAARFCINLVLNTYDDFYLPAIEELKPARANNALLPASERFDAVDYWSSTETYQDGRNDLALFTSAGNNESVTTKANTMKARAFRRVAA